MLFLRLINPRTCTVNLINYLIFSFKKLNLKLKKNYFSDIFYKRYAKLAQIGDSSKRENINNNYPNEPDQTYGDIDEDADDSAYLGSSSMLADNEDEKSQPAPFKYKPKTEIGQDVAPKKDFYVDYEGYRFPARLDNPWAVAKVLNQSKGRLTMKELKTSAKSNNRIKISAQIKEAIFLKKVTELEDEERRNQLKWQVKLGESLIDEQARQDILASRAQAVYDYKV